MTSCAPGWVKRLALGSTLLLFAACSASHHERGDQAGQEADADVSSEHDAAAPHDAGTLHEDARVADAAESEAGVCTRDEECTLVRAECCGCGFTTANVLALSRGPAEAEHASKCADAGCGAGACIVAAYDPLRPWPAPACSAGKCVARDLREADATACTQDSDCQLAPERNACCGSCSADPRSYRALRRGARPALAGNACAGDVECPACTAAYLPTAYCARDQHCAVRATHAVAGQPNEQCFAPGHRAETAYDPGAVGCDCFHGDEDVCEGPAALVCLDGRWTAVQDGPCGPLP